MEIDNDPRERPLERPLTHLEPLRLEVVRDRQAREVWEQIVDGYHYLVSERKALTPGVAMNCSAGWLGSSCGCCDACT